MLQLNALLQGARQRQRGGTRRQRGKVRVPEPGPEIRRDKNVQLYGFVQLPLYQYVNGVQLAADWAAVAGISTRF